MRDGTRFRTIESRNPKVRNTERFVSGPMPAYRPVSSSGNQSAESLKPQPPGTAEGSENSVYGPGIGKPGSRCAACDVLSR